MFYRNQEASCKGAAGITAVLIAVGFTLAGLLGACAGAGGGTKPAEAPKVTIHPEKLTMTVTSEKIVGGFKWPESVAYNPVVKALYVSEFGSKLDPTLKDGAGYIMMVGLDGKVLDPHFLPAGDVKLNKPKGIWVEHGYLWVTDIDGVWQFDLGTKKGRKVMLPGAVFANDPIVKDGVLYVSDNRADMLFSVTPANFIDSTGEPKAEQVWSGMGINPNGLYPAKDGSILMAGFDSATSPRGIYAQTLPYGPRPQTGRIGRLDGLYEASDGMILFTDWDTGAVYQDMPGKKGGPEPFSAGYAGPADLCAFEHEGGLMVVVPDLVKSELHFIQLAHRAMKK